MEYVKCVCCKIQTQTHFLHSNNQVYLYTCRFVGFWIWFEGCRWKTLRLLTAAWPCPEILGLSLLCASVLSATIKLQTGSNTNTQRKGQAQYTFLSSCQSSTLPMFMFSTRSRLYSFSLLKGWSSSSTWFVRYLHLKKVVQLLLGACQIPLTWGKFGLMGFEKF